MSFSKNKDFWGWRDSSSEKLSEGNFKMKKIAKGEMKRNLIISNKNQIVLNVKTHFNNSWNL